MSGTKTARGRRELPLTDEVAEALRAIQEMQAEERRSAGGAYQAIDFIVVDEIGQPLRPETYSDEFTRLSELAGITIIQLHDAQHTSVTLKRSEGWPDHLVALRHGHDESVMCATYTHSYLDDLRRHAEARRHGS